MSANISHFLKHWIPWRIVDPSGNADCEWLFAGDHQFTAPFFDDTLAALRRDPINRRGYKISSSLTMMQQWGCEIESVEPTAIIFHVSRCGSTLLSQMLAMDPKNIVLSEVPFLDEVLRLPYKNPDVHADQAVTCLNAAVRLYGCRRFAYQERLFIKADSWHLHFYDQLRALYPGIPFILLYRDPLEVMHSQQKQRGVQSVPGMVEGDIFGFTPRQKEEFNLDHYMANVLHSYFKKMIHIAQADDNAFAFNYSDGMDTLARWIYSMCGAIASPGWEEQINARKSYHAKHPQLVFHEEAMKREIPAYLVPIYFLYEQMEQLRPARVKD